MLTTTSISCVRLLTLNRPERRNALGTATMQRLHAELVAADRDDAVHAIVLTGAPPAFCAGSDLKELAGLSIAQMCDHESATAAVARTIAALSKPVVCAVEGYALGGGCILAVSCDIVVTSRDARWHLPEVRNGWLPPWGLHALIARVGAVRARLLTWGVQPIDGAEAHRLGVADYAVDAGQADTCAQDVAAQLAALPLNAVASAKRFYAPFVAADGERLDWEASRRFAADCMHPAAQATLAKFGVKP